MGSWWQSLPLRNCLLRFCDQQAFSICFLSLEDRILLPIKTGSQQVCNLSYRDLHQCFLPITHRQKHANIQCIQTYNITVVYTLVTRHLYNTTFSLSDHPLRCSQHSRLHISGTSVIGHLYNPTFSLIQPSYEVQPPYESMLSLIVLL